MDEKIVAASIVLVSLSGCLSTGKAFNKLMTPYATQENKTSLAFHWQLNVIHNHEMNVCVMPNRGKMVVDTGIVKQLKLTDAVTTLIMRHDMIYDLPKHPKVVAS